MKDWLLKSFPDEGSDALFILFIGIIVEKQSIGKASAADFGVARATPPDFGVLTDVELGAKNMGATRG